MKALLLVHLGMLVFASCVLAHPRVKKLTDRTGREAARTRLSAGHVPLVQHNSRVGPESYYNTTKATKKEDISASRDSRASKRGAFAAVLANPKVQEAVVDKGIEVAGKLVDKQLQIIDDAQQKAADFLKKEIKLDITPDKGWESENMFVPPGYHIDASVTGGGESPKEVGEIPYVFPAGLGTALMNGCWGTDYKETDPCYSAKWKSNVCQDMIDGAAFMGVGFDARGKYSPESRKISIVQRNCANKATYDGLDVPDTMNVHGIYDTSASMMTFESREEYQKQIQQEAGVSGSYFGFSAGVKEAWGESTASSRQKYMAVMDIDVDRYEIFMDEVKPQDLSMSFLREFMSLPTSYFSAGGPLRFQNYIQRWGTHFIKSAKFGGQLEIRKTMDANDTKSKKDFEIQMEMEYKTLFASVGAKASVQESESSREQSKTTSTSVVAHGGSQDIASILSDVYSPTFKTEFKEWLKTIPTYPKAFRFQMGSITDLLNFRANDLFQEDTVNWGCEGNAAHLRTEKKDGKTLKYYEVTGTDGRTARYYCEYDSRQALEDAIQMRRTSLKRAIEIYMEEGAMSISDIELNTCTKKDQPFNDNPRSHFWRRKGIPLWETITKHSKEFKVSFDMLDNLPNVYREGLDIGRDMNRLVRYYKKKWYTSDRDGSFHLYGGFDNGNSGDTSRRKISIFGLVLTFQEADGSLVLSRSDFNASKKFFPTLSDELMGIELARVYKPSGKSDKRTKVTTPAQPALGQPCQIKWSNALRFDPTDSKGKCLHFTASTAGTIYVVFAALPNDLDSRYYVEISPERVAIFKGTTLKTSTTNSNARALGDASLYQSYFVCITESEQSTLIEYGKSLGTSDSGDIYLNMIDIQDPINARFYAFGNDEKPAKIMDAHLVSRRLTIAECKGDTVKDMETDLCVQKCHKDCDPLAGCKSSADGPVSPDLSDGCNACRVALDVQNSRCIPECPEHKTLTKGKQCVPTFDARDSVTFYNFPSTSEFTMCLWINLDIESGGGTSIAVQYSQKNSGILITLRHKSRTETELRYLVGPAFQQENDIRMSVNQLMDYQWHQICATWSGFNGVARCYLDATEPSSVETPARGELVGGGGLSVGDPQFHRLTFTEFHVWDRVLSDQDIANNAKKCDAGIGNVIQWHQGFEYLTTNNKTYTSPSVCRAPVPAAETVIPPNSEGSG